MNILFLVFALLSLYFAVITTFSICKNFASYTLTWSDAVDVVADLGETAAII